MEKIIVLDTETTNSLDDPICYDIGFIVCDLEGTIYSKHSFVNADVFCNKELMESAFFKDKIPTYWEQIKKGERTLTSFNNIKWTLRHIMKENEVTKVFAYNCRFDYISLVTTERYLTKSKYRYVLPYQTTFCDILAYSREILKTDNKYREFCINNNYLTSRNANRYTAEIVARYFFNKDFIEEHTALSDCEIEYKILLECIKINPNFDCKMW